VATLVRRFFFVIGLLFIAVFGWRMFNASHEKRPQVTFASFSQRVAAGDVEKSSIYMGYSAIKRLSDARVAVGFANVRRTEGSELVLDLLPFILIPIVFGYFYYLRRRTRA
jgi:hypothetical protein